LVLELSLISPLKLSVIINSYTQGEDNDVLKWPKSGCFSSPLRRDGKKEDRSQDNNQSCLHGVQGKNLHINKEQKKRHTEDGVEQVLSPVSYPPASQGGKIGFSEYLHKVDISGN
jgi:hypothetical protein